MSYEEIEELVSLHNEKGLSWKYEMPSLLLPKSELVNKCSLYL